MSKIIIKNEHGSIVRVHVYGELELPKHKADFVVFESFLPNFWRIEESFHD